MIFPFAYDLRKYSPLDIVPISLSPLITSGAFASGQFLPEGGVMSSHVSSLQVFASGVVHHDYTSLLQCLAPSFFLVLHWLLVLDHLDTFCSPRFLEQIGTNH